MRVPIQCWGSLPVTGWFSIHKYYNFTVIVFPSETIQCWGLLPNSPVYLREFCVLFLVVNERYNLTHISQRRFLVVKAFRVLLTLQLSSVVISQFGALVISVFVMNLNFYLYIVTVYYHWFLPPLFLHQKRYLRNFVTYLLLHYYEIRHLWLSVNHCFWIFIEYSSSPLSLAENTGPVMNFMIGLIKWMVQKSYVVCKSTKERGLRIWPNVNEMRGLT